LTLATDACLELGAQAEHSEDALASAKPRISAPVTEQVRRLQIPQVTRAEAGHCRSIGRGRELLW
jgi:hypothetical protein